MVLLFIEKRKKKPDKALQSLATLEVLHIFMKIKRAMHKKTKEEEEEEKDA